MRTILLLALVIGVAVMAYRLRGHLPIGPGSARQPEPVDTHYGGAGRAMCGAPLRKGETVQMVPAYVTCTDCRRRLPRA